MLKDVTSWVFLMALVASVSAQSCSTHIANAEAEIFICPDESTNTCDASCSALWSAYVNTIQSCIGIDGVTQTQYSDALLQCQATCMNLDSQCQQSSTDYDDFNLNNIIATALGSSMTFWTAGTNAPQFQIVQDCDGVLHVAINGMNVANFAAPAFMRLDTAIYNVIYQKVQCACPSASEADIKAAFSPVPQLLSMLYGLPMNVTLPDCPPFVANDLFAMAGMPTPTPGTPLISEIASCTMNSWLQDGTCSFNLNYAEGLAPLQVGLSACANSGTFFYSITGESTNMEFPNFFCTSGADCLGSNVCNPLSDSTINGFLSSVGLFGPDESLPDCTTGMSFLVSVYNKVMASMMQSPYSGTPTGVCMPPYGQMLKMPALTAMFSDWDGTFSAGGTFNQADRTAGTAPGLTSPFGSAYTSAPTAGSFTSVLGWACDQLYGFLLPNVGFSLQLPFVNLMLNGAYEAISELEQCRAKSLGAALTSDQMSMRFKPWGMLSLLYQQTVTPVQNLGVAMSDWLFFLPQPYSSGYPLLRETGSGEIMKVAMPSTCTFEKYVQTQRCALDLTLNNSYLANSQIQFHLDVKQCPSVDVGPQLAGGIPNINLFQSTSFMNNLMKPCPGNSQCGAGFSCLNLEDVIPGVDLLGQALFGQDACDSEFAACCDATTLYENLVTMITATNNPSSSSSTPTANDGNLQYCVPFAAGYVQYIQQVASGPQGTQGSDSAAASMLSTMSGIFAQQFANFTNYVPGQPVVLSALSPWTDPVAVSVYAPGLTGGDIAAIVIGVILGVALIVFGAFYTVRRRKLRSNNLGNPLLNTAI